MADHHDHHNKPLTDVELRIKNVGGFSSVDQEPVEPTQEARVGRSSMLTIYVVQ